ncbi:hypothetical protein TKK_0015361 [Trichogramma kaykai]
MPLSEELVVMRHHFWSTTPSRSLLFTRLPSSQHMIYADDTQIFCSDLPTHAHILLDRTNSDISAIVAWVDDNGIGLNSGKTGAIICGSQFYVNALKDSTPPLFVDDAQLQMMPELTILGLKLTPTLGWDPQVSRVCSSVHYTLYSLRYYRHAPKRSLRKNLVESLIFPIFDYGSSVFYDLNKDVRNAFNSARWNKILIVLSQMEVPAYMLRMVISYFHDRLLKLTMDDGAESYDVTAGRPQGFVLGPILWNVMYDKILRLKLPESAKIMGFADDIAVTVVAKQLDLVEFYSKETIRLLFLL